MEFVQRFAATKKTTVMAREIDHIYNCIQVFTNKQ